MAEPQTKSSGKEPYSRGSSAWKARQEVRSRSGRGRSTWKARQEVRSRSARGRSMARCY